MLKLHNIVKSLSATALLALSSLVEAGSSGSFSYTPGGLPDSATAVPALSDALLVVLGLLMIVIAVRTLKGNRGYQKFLSVAVLAGGLLIGGLGAERTLATIGFIAGETEGIGCEAASTTGYDPDPGVTFQNGCEVAGTMENEFICSCSEIPGTCDGVTVGPGESCDLKSCEYDC